MSYPKFWEKLFGDGTKLLGSVLPFGTTVPKANSGSGAAGTSTEPARADHVHPAQTSLSGNASTATKLATARTVRTNLASTKAASFDGSANITPGVTGILPAANGGTGNANGLAASATKLATARNISLTGDVTGSASFNGTTNASIAATVNAANLIQKNGGLAVNSSKKLYLNFGSMPEGQVKDITTALVKAGGGLAVDSSTGKLYVNFDAMPDSQMEAIVQAMVQEGGGIAVDSSGQLYVDFESMPTDKFEAMLKSIRVPIWLSRDKNFYVDGATGNDEPDAGRGESEEKPFKTIQACINHVSDNYNISRYTAVINVKNTTTYSEWLTLPNFNRTTGSILIKSLDSLSIVTISYVGPPHVVCNVSDGNWKLQDINFDVTITNVQENNVATYIIYSELGKCVLDNVKIICRQAGVVQRVQDIDIIRSSGGTISVKVASITTSRESENINYNIFTVSNSGIIRLNDDSSVQHTLTLSGVADITAIAFNTGRITCSAATADYPFKIVNNGYTANTRYSCLSGGSINTFGKGPDFFPGTEAGKVDTAKCSWYA